MFLSETDRETLLNTLNARSPELIQARMANALLLLDEASVAGWQDMFSKHSPKAA